MDIRKYLIILLLMLVNIPITYAECTKEEIDNLKLETNKIEIVYKHLGEITKEDGSKVYNEYMVTAKNIPENIYVHLSPMTEENFALEDNELKIILTTGEWVYSLYSSQCDAIIDEIIINLPTFNKYSLDPLCKDVNVEDFELCDKYYKYEVDRETFERRVNDYKKNHPTNIDEKNKDKNDILNKIINFIKINFLYIAIVFAIVIIIIFVNIIVKKINKRKIL